MLPTDPANQASPSAETGDADEDYYRRVHRWLSIILKSTIGIGAILLLVRGNYQAAMESLIIMYVTMLPISMARYFHIRIPFVFDTIAIVFIYMSLFLGEVHNFYARFWWWDLVLHASSGFLLGITGFVLVYALNQNRKINMHLSPLFIATFAFMFAQALGSIWEIFEFAMDQLFGLNMQKSGIVDTMWDMIVNAIAALAIALLGYGYMKTAEVDSFLERMIHRFIRENPKLFRKRRRQL
ncbi:MAG: hypothetical protein RLZZ227_162 [Pseudomonadota bacterium]|jgi:hypothetical protein